MSSRTPIQVPEELKAKVDELKGKWNVKTHYEVIEKLISSNNDFKKFKEEQRRIGQEEKEQQRLKDEQEKERQRKETVDLGEETKAKFIAFKEEMNFEEDASVFELLLYHYLNSQSVDKATLAFSRSLK